MPSLIVRHARRHARACPGHPTSEAAGLDGQAPAVTAGPTVILFETWRYAGTYEPARPIPRRWLRPPRGIGVGVPARG
jgi:hypothetical protein